MSRVFGSALVACGLFLLFSLIAEQALAAYNGVPIWVAERVPGRMALLRPGMTEPQVMTALGLTGRSVGPLVGGGPNNAMHGAYPLQPGMSMSLTFDTTRTPWRFVYGDVRDDGTLRLWAAFGMGLTLLGACLARRGSKRVGQIGGR